MSIFLFLVGTLLINTIGYGTVRLSEGRTPLLLQVERIGYGMILGPTIVTMVSFWMERIGIIHFTRAGFGTAMAALILVTFLPLCLSRSTLRGALPVSTNENITLNRTKKLFIFLFVLYTSLKLFAGMYEIGRAHV